MTRFAAYLHDHRDPWNLLGMFLGTFPHEHRTDSDCLRHGYDLRTDSCRVCGATFGDPCPHCDQHAYHAPDCPTLGERTLPE